MASLHRADLLDGRYEIRRLIGSGGMADVYLAVDRGMDRDVAIKVLNHERAEDPAFVERFRREALAAAALSNPHVVAVYDWGAVDDTTYMVMEYAAGGDLGDLLARRGPLPEVEALALGAQAASALDEAHRHGIVHRDVKPCNILLDGHGDVKVADFGIARAMGTARLTETATILGSAYYLSPEQAQGKSLDGRSDVYSLGVVLYEMLAGAPPFDGDSPIAIALHHMSDPPTPLRQVRRDLSPAVEMIVRKALAKDPNGRYQTAAQLRGALEDARGRLAPARPTTMTMPLVPRTTGQAASERTTRALLVPAQSMTANWASGGATNGRRIPLVVTAALALALIAVATRLMLGGALGRQAAGTTPTAAPAAVSPALVAPSATAPSRTFVPTAVVLAAVGAPSPISTLNTLPSPVPTRRAAPTPAASPTIEPTATGTITSLQGATATPLPVPRTPLVASDSGADPSLAVVRFYQLVGVHNFGGAAQLWSARMQAANPPAESVAKRFAQTRQIVVRQATVTSRDDAMGFATVAVDLVEIDVGAPGREIVGSWQLVRGPSGWLMDQPNLRYA